ncbi:unnamed protein product [Effrenium voratum]|nr:unnamed protein product [Effrenium voratum]
MPFGSHGISRLARSHGIGGFLAQVQDELDCAGHSLSDLAQRFEQRQKVRSRLHGPALDWSRQTSEDSNASVTEFNFLFEGTSGTA